MKLLAYRHAASIHKRDGVQSHATKPARRPVQSAGNR